MDQIDFYTEATACLSDLDGLVSELEELRDQDLSSAQRQALDKVLGHLRDASDALDEIDNNESES